MFTPILYTALAVINLIGYCVGIVFLPDLVPIQIAGGVVEGLGSPWALIALPSVTALLSLGVFLVSGKQGLKHKGLSNLLIGLVGILFAVIGWVFFAYAASGAAVGERVLFPYGAAIVLPLALLSVVYGVHLPHAEQGAAYVVRGKGAGKDDALWSHTVTVGRAAFMTAGLFTAVSAVLVSCLAPAFDFFPAILLFLSLALACLATVLFPKAIRG